MFKTINQAFIKAGNDKRYNIILLISLLLIIASIIFANTWLFIIAIGFSTANMVMLFLFIREVRKDENRKQKKGS